MNWKYVEWEIVPGLKVPMMEDEAGNLFGTNKTVAGMLGMSEEGVRAIYHDNAAEFEQISVANSNAKEFMKNNKALFGIKRIRQDMRLWTDDDILTFCYRATGANAIDIRRKFSKFIKEHSKRKYISIEAYEKLKETVTKQEKTIMQQGLDFEAFKTYVMRHVAFVDESASLAGKALNLQKGTKALREMH